MAYKVHPGIGVARVGDSPTDWFIGPETFAEPDPPYGGYRDAAGRIKRQAGRFRVFDHVGGTATPVSGTLVTWTVVLGPSAAGPSATLTGPNQVQKLAGTPSWGEIRTDSEGNLLVLSGVVALGFNGAGCGRITAWVGGVEAAKSWILLLPPNFSPSRRPSYSVYDHLIELAGGGVPSPLLFMRDIYPILKGMEIGDANLPFGNAADHATASGYSVFSGTSACNNQLTATAHAIVANWLAGTFTNDWTAPPPPPSIDDPNELDRGPLSRVAFGGWDLHSGPATELSSLQFLAADPLRLDLAPPNDYPATFDGFADWTTDNCTGEWPQIWGTAGTVPAPATNPWATRGFVVRQAGAPTYVEDLVGVEIGALIPFVMLQTRQLEFGSVRQSATHTETAAIVFEVGHRSAGASFTLTLPPWLTGPSSYTVAAQAPGVVTTERIPITYAPGTSNVDHNGVIQVQQMGGPLYSIPVHAATVDALATEVAFALDFSISMIGLCADGMPKVDKLRQALDSFITLTQPDDGLGAAAFNHGTLGTLALGPPDTSLHDFAASFAPSGTTSVGRGIQDAAGVLAGGTSARQALIVVTDGMENTAPLINDAMSSVADPTRVFAVGIGRPEDVNTSALQALCGNQGGYLLLTGSMAAADQALVLDKYFLRILANATNIDTILDPPTTLTPGKVERIAFPISEFDHAFDAIVLTHERESIVFALEAPDGTIVTPATLEGFAGNAYVSRGNVSYYRVRLPLPLASAPAVATGTWHLVLSVRRPEAERLAQELSHLSYAAAPRLARSSKAAQPVDCETVIHTQSDLHLDATLQQVSIAPGAAVLLEALLTVKGKPFAGKVRATAQVQGPTGHLFTLDLRSEGTGRFVGRFEPIRPGIHRITTVCQGTTPKGHAFRREQLATAAVYDDRNGSRRDPEAGADPQPPEGGSDEPPCEEHRHCKHPPPRRPCPHCHAHRHRCDHGRCCDHRHCAEHGHCESACRHHSD